MAAICTPPVSNRDRVQTVMNSHASQGFLDLIQTGPHQQIWNTIAPWVPVLFNTSHLIFAEPTDKTPDLCALSNRP